MLFWLPLLCKSMLHSGRKTCEQRQSQSVWTLNSICMWGCERFKCAESRWKPDLYLKRAFFKDWDVTDWDARVFPLDLLIVNSIPFQVFLKCVIPVARGHTSQINAAVPAAHSLLPSSQLQKTSLLYQQLQESQYSRQSLACILYL